MSTKSTIDFGRGLAVRQAYMTVGIALLVGFLMALILLFFEYQSEQRRIEQQLQRVITSSSAVAAESLWTLSTDLADVVSEGLVSQPLIVEATIETFTGTVLSQHSRPAVSECWLDTLSFLFGPTRVEVIPLFHKNDLVGHLKLNIDPLPARQVFFKRIQYIAVGELVKTLILAAALLALFYITLARPIRNYANWVERIDPDNPVGWRRAPPRREQRDELTALGESIFQRLVQARTYFLELQQTRSALETLNQELEDRVQVRTKELEVALARAEHLATTDVMTGIPNRRSFMDQAEKRHAEWLRYKRPYALLMIDLDTFKQINDTYGHPAGDQVLISVAAVLQQHTRCEDIIGRIGGEEFCALLVGVSEVGAINLTERIRAEIAKLPIEFGGQSIPVTASFGLVPPESLQEDFDEVLKHGDQMLYQAKNEGRNRVCIYHSEICTSAH
ncbi:Putative diguanylate cyclase (GGDEF domain) [Moritella sp. PE36]|uniref:GGDEF domain-containing protein n=1 Tax=Moritella sp. PE36 TaxID=58051 RepID=UPI000156849A|nr:diguanylate cyclase [Moritella sp. PE36]EDM67658.1 Putative diguanylate cyclase (GGDEF domain) [Moritella sp. PE36]